MKINQTCGRKSNVQTKLLFMITVLAAVFYFNPGSAHAGIQVVKHQRVSLIIETFTHQNLFDDSSGDSYISKNDESSSEDDENDEEDDDDWEA